MIDIFYYIGFLCLALCIEEVFNNKRRKQTVFKLEEAFDSTLESVVVNGVSNVPYKNILKKAMGKNIRIILGFIALFWNIAGVFISVQKPMFIMLLCISLFPSTFLTKNEMKKYYILIFDSIICLIIVSFILFYHFIYK